MEINGSIFWGNSDISGSGEASQINYSGSVPPFLRYCTVQGWTGAWGGLFNNGLDPQFIDDSGRLSATSPCIDSGDNNLVPVGMTTDFDGNPRFVDNPDVADTGAGEPPIVDRGAFEHQDGLCVDPDCDNDGVANSEDNCLLTPNNGQEDHDGDGQGDACDDDMDDDGVANAIDVCDFTPSGTDVDSNGTIVNDLDGDCDADLEDFALWQLRITGP